MAAQCERVFITRGQVANAEHAHQRFQLVGQSQHAARVVAWQFIARKAGLVMVFDGQSHAVAQALGAGIVAAHDALQLGKFAHHIGEQIGFCQSRGFLHLAVQDVKTLFVFGAVGAGRHAQLVHNGMGDLPHALAALGLCAQLIVIHHLGQAADAAFECFFAILVEKEFGIRQAGVYHALVAVDDSAGVLRLDVADDQKLVGQFALRIQQREVFLVGLHGQNQAFLRHFQKLFLKLANQHMGALHQGSDFIQQGLIFNGANAAAHLLRGGLQLAGNFVASLVKAGNHGACFAQIPRIVVRIGQFNAVARGLKTVAACGAACLQAQSCNRHHVFSAQGHQTMHGAHKLHAAPARQFAACV